MKTESVSTSPQPAPAPSAHRRTLADRLLGLVGGAMIVAAIVLFVVGGEEDDGSAAQAAGPVLELVQPSHGSELRTERLMVVFRSDLPLAPMAGGWGVDSLHLHLNLDGTELMPAPGDIERLPNGVFRWSLPRPGPGVHTLRLLWSGPDHRPLQGGGSRAVQILVKE